MTTTVDDGQLKTTTDNDYRRLRDKCCGNG